jgi:hypothetical protein
VPDEPAANEALTREIDALRDVLAHVKVDLARERVEQETTLAELGRLKHALRVLDASQRELFAKLGGGEAA